MEGTCIGWGVANQGAMCCKRLYTVSWSVVDTGDAVVEEDSDARRVANTVVSPIPRHTIGCRSRSRSGLKSSAVHWRMVMVSGVR